MEKTLLLHPVLQKEMLVKDCFSEVQDIGIKWIASCAKCSPPVFFVPNSVSDSLHASSYKFTVGKLATKELLAKTFLKCMGMH